ncbi:AHH domain-containing protein, partial [Bacillus wiedmannii]
VKTTFLQGNEKIQHAVKTLLEYKWIPGEGKGFAMAGVGNVSGGGQYSLKEAYQYMESKVVKGTGEGSRIIPGTPGIVTGGNSTKLGKNMMTEMGLRRSTKWSGYQAQHIIPSEMADNPVIKKIGMNFDDSSNGIFLRVPDDNISTMARHRGYHSVYNEVVARALNKMDINQSIDSLQKQVYDLQKNLRKLQGNGLPLYPSQGATVELWERKLKQLEIQNK